MLFYNVIRPHFRETNVKIIKEHIIYISLHEGQSIFFLLIFNKNKIYSRQIRKEVFHFKI